MKKLILIASITMLPTVTVFFACQSSEAKQQDAEENVQKNLEELANSKRELYQLRNDTLSDYEKFKKDSEAKIIYIETSIAELKANIKNETIEDKETYQENLILLEQKSIELKKKLSDLKDEGEDNWISIRNEFYKDMEELGTAFKNINN
jgi:hypothetical protein